MSDPYSQLVELAMAERRLAREADSEGLETIAAERVALVAGLPDVPPVTALPALEEALRIQTETTEEIGHAMAATTATFQRLRKGRESASAYAPTTPAPAPSIDRAG